MTDYLFPAPAEKVIPVTLGADVAFTLQRVDAAANPINYNPGTAIALWIDINKAAPSRVDFVVTNSSAAVKMLPTITDTIKTGTRWRIILYAAGSEVPLLVGKFERHDG